MLLGLTRQLRPGETFPLTLVFERSGRITTEVRVEGAGARGPSGHHGH
jgi:copper(I)-binding protein